MRRSTIQAQLPSLVCLVLFASGFVIAPGCGASGAATTVAAGASQATLTGGAFGLGALNGGGGISQVSTSIGNGGTGGFILVGPTGGAVSLGGNRGTGGARPTGGVAATGGVRVATGGMAATGGTTTSGPINPPITGSNGFATRYWDCCKPSCAWTTAVPSCQKDGSTRITDRNAKSGCDSGGTAFECYDFSPWYDSTTNMAYGFAAYNASGCGVCYELQFTGEGQYGANNGAINIKGKQMIVQVINIGNITAGQFDLLIPGGGVGAMANGCSAQMGSVDQGATNGGLYTECNQDLTCVVTKCASSFSGKTGLLAGCSWFTGWFAGADNPKVIYKQVACPSQITSKSGISG